MPVAAVIDEKIFCMHGGLSPDLNSLEQIKRIMRPTDVPDTGLLCDLYAAPLRFPPLCLVTTRAGYGVTRTRTSRDGATTTAG